MESDTKTIDVGAEVDLTSELEKTIIDLTPMKFDGEKGVIDHLIAEEDDQIIENRPSFEAIVFITRQQQRQIHLEFQNSVVGTPSDTKFHCYNSYDFEVVNL